MLNQCQQLEQFDDLCVNFLKLWCLGVEQVLFGLMPSNIIMEFQGNIPDVNQVLNEDSSNLFQNFENSEHF